MLEGLAAKIGLNILFGRLKKVPWQVWAGIGAAVLLVFAIWLHQYQVHELYKEAYEAGQKAERKVWKTRLAKAQAEGDRWRDDYEKTAAKLTAKIGENHALETRLVAARANDLRLRGPGRAAICPGSTPGTGGPEPTGGGPDAPLAPMPPEQPMAIVPWGDLVRHAEEADLNRSEVQTWRTWYVQNVEALRKAKLELPKPIYLEGQE